MAVPANFGSASASDRQVSKGFSGVPAINLRRDSSLAGTATTARHRCPTCAQHNTLVKQNGIPLLMYMTTSLHYPIWATLWPPLQRNICRPWLTYPCALAQAAYLGIMYADTSAAFWPKLNSMLFTPCCSSGPIMSCGSNTRDTR